MKKFYLIALVMLFSRTIMAQSYTAKFEDGKEINYDVISDKMDGMNKVNILISGGIGISYFQPNICFVEAKYSYFGVKGFDGNIFLKSFTKTKDKGITLMSKSAGYKSYINYNTKYKLERKIYLGIHCGFSNINYSSNPISSYNVKENEVAIGIGITRGFNITYTTHAYKKPKTWTRSRQLNLFADILISAGHTIMNNSNTEKVITSKDVSPVGFRTYLAGKSGIGRKSDRFGLTYNLGVGINTLKKVYPIAALGLYIGLVK
jgi:hypothetical protein